MEGEVAPKLDRDAMIRAVDRAGHAIDLTPAWPLLERVLREWKPARIQLFGSRARGDAHRDSDWDFLVVVPDELPKTSDPVALWRLRKEAGVRADLVVYCARDFEADRVVPNTLAYEADSAGVPVYER